jgi:glycogen(starch) synthase
MAALSLREGSSVRCDAVPALRVLMVSWEYPPVMYGGLGRHVHALSGSLARAGHDVVVLTQAPEGRTVPAPAGEGEPRVVRAPLEQGFPDVYADTAGFVRALQARLVNAQADSLGDWRPDVVHGHDWVVAEASTTLAQRFGVPLVATVHATESGLYHGHLDGGFSRWRDEVERALVARADRTIVCSQAMRTEVVTALGADPDRVVVVPNGVDLSRWQTSPQERAVARERLGVADGPLLVLVGRLEHEKGAADAIDALALLGATRPTAHLVLVGDGARADDLSERAAARGVGERVHQVGRLPDREVAAVVGASDVALVPSRYEPFGLVALEAMAAGTPVVVTRTGGLPEVVEHGHTGAVVPPADPAALAAAVGGLLDDPARGRQLGANATTVVAQRYGWAPVAAATAAVYADVLD